MIRRVESQAINGIAIFYKFSAKCQVPDFLWSVPGSCCNWSPQLITGTLRKKLESGIFGTHFLKMQILRFHDLITKIGC